MRTMEAKGLPAKQALADLQELLEEVRPAARPNSIPGVPACSRASSTAAAVAASAVAVIALAALAVVTVVDVGGRYLFNKPLLGTVEMSEFLMVILSFGALALAELRNSHITVDFFVTRASRARAQRCSRQSPRSSASLFWSFVAWRAAVHAHRIWIGRRGLGQSRSSRPGRSTWQ